MLSRVEFGETSRQLKSHLNGQKAPGSETSAVVVTRRVYCIIIFKTENAVVSTHKSKQALVSLFSKGTTPV